MPKRPASRALALLLTTACGAGGDLDPEDVLNIPSGSAAGSEYTGDYRVDLRTLECSGSCGPFETGSFRFGLCDVGQSDDNDVIVEHRDGDLSVMFTDIRLDGGVYADGSFEIGGLATEFGGAVEMTARASGSFRPNGSAEGSVDFRIRGEVSAGQFADCRGVRAMEAAPE